jgi:hypothetical protein
VRVRSDGLTGAAITPPQKRDRADQVDRKEPRQPRNPREHGHQRRDASGIPGEQALISIHCKRIQAKISRGSEAGTIDTQPSARPRECRIRRAR